MQYVSVEPRPKPSPPSRPGFRLHTGLKGAGQAGPLFVSTSCYRAFFSGACPASCQSSNSAMKFLDQAKIFVSLRRRRRWRRVASGARRFIEIGGPDGGNGGKGGDIVVEAGRGLNTLIDFRYTQHFRAGRGGHGMGRDRTGAGADDLVDHGAGRHPDPRRGQGDPARRPRPRRPARRACCAAAMAASAMPISRPPPTGRRASANPGWPGEEKWVWLRLKLIADAGLVGLPNAGKSTFLAARLRAPSRRSPTIPSPRCTRNSGVVAIGEREFVLADIPGLIEGAHEGAGIGDRFLGHVERCRVLLHLVDGTERRRRSSA